jgi:hypothetical protein
MSIKLNSLADIQNELLAPVQWAMNCTYHHSSGNIGSTCLSLQNGYANKLYGALAIHLPMTYQATTNHDNLHENAHQVPHMYLVGDLVLIHQDTNHDNLHENAHQVPHMYIVGDLVLIHQDTCGKLAKPTCGPYRLIDVACQHVNGTFMVDLNHSHETFNIW